MKSKLMFSQAALVCLTALFGVIKTSTTVEADVIPDPGGSDSPRLSLDFRDGGLVITWPAAAGGWVLEQAPHLDGPIPWTVVPLGLAQTNATNVTLAVAPATETMMFYRLRKLVVPGLAGDWSFDEGSGQVALDGTGFENRATLTNTSWSAGRIGSGALWFNGGAATASGRSRVCVSNDNFRVLPDSGQPFSVSLWFNPDALTTGWRGLIGNDANGTNGWHLALHSSGPGTNELVFASSGPGTLNLSVLPPLPGLVPGQWHEVTATYDGSEGMIYFDGALLTRGNGTVSANSDPIYFGGGVANYDSFLGLIDEVRIYTNTLPAEDISLAGAWQMDENRGTFLADSSIHRHHATLSSDTAWVAGKNGSGVNLSNSTIMIRNDSADVLPPTGGSFSLSFWLYPNAFTNGSSGLMNCADGTNSGWQLALSRSAGQTQLRFWSTDSGGTLDLSTRLSLPEHVWSKIDLTFNGGTATVYLNGLQLKSSNGGIQGNRMPLIVGAVSGMPNFNGAIDEVKIHRRERQEDEIGPVAKVMWETVLMGTSSNLVLQGFGPTGKPLSYSIADTLSPTNGTITHEPGSPIVTYTAGANKGPDAFAYTLTDGEFTTPPTIVAVSVVAPHWLSTTGGTTPPLDGSSPDHAWIGTPVVALDAIWHTNNYYDCFFYAPGVYETSGANYVDRQTTLPGCKHIGSGSEGPNQTTLRLINALQTWNEGLIFAMGVRSFKAHGFEVHDMLLDCNATNNPKYTVGEPAWIVIPLTATSHVDTVKLRWNQGQIPSTGLLPNSIRTSWQFGAAQDFNVCTRTNSADGYVTNCTSLHSTGAVDVVRVGADTDQIIVQMTRRAYGVDFYSLSEIEVAGASISLPTATAQNGTRSQLNTNTGTYSIVNAFDNNDRSAWASGPENQVDIVIPLEPGTPVGEIDFSWNCQTITNLGRLGPATDYQIKARDPVSGIFQDVPFLQQPRTATGAQANIFSNAVTTDQILIHLKTREMGVDFYSLSEIQLQNNFGQIQPKLPIIWSPFSHSGYTLYSILRAFDGDLTTQWTCGTQGMIGGIDAVGSNLKFLRLKIIGFGAKAIKECFPLFVRTWYVVPEPLGNVLVEDCTMSDPAHDNTDGVTCFDVTPFAGFPMTNTMVRRCSVSGLRPYFTFSQGYYAVNVQNSVASECSKAVYFEPEFGSTEIDTPVLIRSNRFINVQRAVYFFSHASTVFDSITILNNEMVLTPGNAAGFSACDVCESGPSGTMTNVTALNNVIRYADWAPHPEYNEPGLYYSDIQNAVFGNNVVALGSADALRLRQCTAGYIPAKIQKETCDTPEMVLAPASFPPCLDTLPPGYRRVWFNNRDLQGNLLKVRYADNTNPNSTGFASQQQWP